MRIATRECVPVLLNLVPPWISLKLQFRTLEEGASQDKETAESIETEAGRSKRIEVRKKEQDCFD